MLSHAGAARFAYNAGLVYVKASLDVGEKPDWSMYGLRRWWNANKDTLAVNADGTPWWRENSKCEPRRGDNRVRLGADGRKTVLQATTN